MKRIVFLKGQSQYQLSHAFLDALLEGFRQQEIECATLDLSNKTNLQADFDKIFSKNCDALFSFNGISRWILDGKPLASHLNAPEFDWLIDHPLYHFDRLKVEVPNGIVGCVDQSHVRFLEDNFQSKGTHLFLPHGGMVANNMTHVERDIPVLFSGTGVDPRKFETEWQQCNDTTENLIRSVSESALQTNPMPVFELLGQYLQMHFLSVQLEHQIALTRSIENYLRARQRYEILKVLDDAGVSVHIFGTGWDYANFENHIIHQPVSYAQSVELMKRSQISLNISLMFPEGSHERIFTASANGALVVSNESSYIDQEFSEEENIVTYSWANRKQLPEKITHLLENSQHLQKVAKAGEELTLRKHLWKHRAAPIIGLLNL